MSDRPLSERIRALTGWFDPEFSPEAQVVNGLANEVRRLEAPVPQIIRTVEELEALDPDTVVMLDRFGTLTTADCLPHSHNLPAVVVATGEQVRAARKALEEA